MNKTAFCMPILLLLGAAAPAWAQDATACPQLPAGAELNWEHRGTAGSDFCRALRADGSEAFGLYIAQESPFKPQRGNREETGRIAGKQVQWYRAEIATQPGVKARETLIRLDDGRVAHMWMQAGSDEALNQSFRLAENLRFGGNRGSQVATGQ